MTIEIKEGRYFIGVWFMGDGKMDWMSAIWRDKDDPVDRWQMTYRFRYYKNKDAWDGQDKKNWYSGTITGAPEAEVERKHHEVSHMFRDHWAELHGGRARLDFVAMHSDDPVENSKRLMAREWAHSKVQEVADEREKS